MRPPQVETCDKAHGRIETRQLWASCDLNDYLDFPHVGQVFALRRTRIIVRRDATTKNESETVFGVTSLTSDRATPADLLELSRQHWAIENRLHWVRDVTFDEDRSQVRSKNAPQVLAALRNTAIGLLRLAGSDTIASAIRALAAKVDLALRLLGLPQPST